MIRKTRIAKTVAGIAGMSMAFSAAFPVAAVTTAELQAQIAALMAQLAALQGGASACASFSQDLTVGSTGPQVVALQQMLVAQGHLSMPAGTAYGYFGSLTKAAVARWQAANGISPAVGYFGPMSRARANACASGTTTGGTTAGGTTTGGTTGALQGGAGSIDDTTLISTLNNEEVGEDENDVQVAGLEVEVDDGSDIRLTAVRLVFDEGTATEDFDTYATDVSLWLDGKLVAREDADEFNSDNAWSKTISLDAGAIIRAGDTGDLIVAVSGINNLDSADAGDTWTVDFTQIRFVDASGASITETVTEDARTFSFETLATAAGAELKVSLADSNPDAQVVNIDDVNDTDGVVLLRFNLEAEGDSDIRVRDLPITFTVTGATDVDAVAHTAYLTVNGKTYSETITTSAAAASVTFDDFDLTINAGAEVEVVVKVDINDTDANLDEGDTIKAELTASNRNVADIDDESGTSLVAGDRTGTALGGVMTLYDVAPLVTLVSVSQSATPQDSATNDTATFVIKYNVKAVDGDIYVSDTGTATTASDITAATVASNMVLYRVDHAGTATTAGLSSAVTFTTSGSNVTDTGVTNGVKITEGSTGSFTLTVTRTNSTANGTAALFRAALKGISWASSDTATQNVYDFNLEDYMTSYVFID